MTAPTAPDLSQREAAASILIVGALAVVVVGVARLAQATPPRTATIAVCVGLAGVAVLAPPSRLQVASRIAGIAAIAVLVPAAALRLFAVEPIDVDRLAGDTAVETSIVVSRRSFPSADTVVVASSRAEPGLVLSSALTRAAPVLYVEGASVGAAVAREVTRLGASRAVAIGLHDAAAARLGALGLAVEIPAPDTTAPSLTMQLQLLDDPGGETVWVAAAGRTADLVVAAAASFRHDSFAVWRPGRAVVANGETKRAVLVGGTAAIADGAVGS